MELCRHLLYVNEPARLMNLFFAHRVNMLVTQLYIHATNSLQMAASALLLLLLHLRTFRRDAGQMTDCVRELSLPRQFFGTAALFSHGRRVHMMAPICPLMPVSFQFYTSEPAAATAGGTVHPILMNKSFLQSLQIWHKNQLGRPALILVGQGFTCADLNYHRNKLRNTATTLLCSLLNAMFQEQKERLSPYF